MDKIGKYDLIRVIGHGATATVHLGNDPFAQRDVAIKVAFPDPEKPGARQALHAPLPERGSLVGKLAHPHIVQIYDAGRRRGPLLHRHGVRAAARSRRVARRHLCCRSSASSKSSSNARARSISPTASASRTATSSRPTSCIPATIRRPATSRSRISARPSSMHRNARRFPASARRLHVAAAGARTARSTTRPTSIRSAS